MTVLDKLNPENITGRLQAAGHDAGAKVSAKLDDGKASFDRAVRRGRRAVEDGIEETAYQVKRHPLSSLAIAFGAGVGFAALLLGPQFIKRNRNQNAGDCVSEVD